MIVASVTGPCFLFGLVAFSLAGDVLSPQSFFQGQIRSTPEALPSGSESVDPTKFIYFNAGSEGTIFRNEDNPDQLFKIFETPLSKKKDENEEKNVEQILEELKPGRDIKIGERHVKEILELFNQLQEEADQRNIKVKIPKMKLAYIESESGGKIWGLLMERIEGEDFQTKEEGDRTIPTNFKDQAEPARAFIGMIQELTSEQSEDGSVESLEDVHEDFLTGYRRKDEDSEGSGVNIFANFKIANGELYNIDPIKMLRLANRMAKKRMALIFARRADNDKLGELLENVLKDPKDILTLENRLIKRHKGKKLEDLDLAEVYTEAVQLLLEKKRGCRRQRSFPRRSG